MSATCGDHQTASQICHPGGGGRLSLHHTTMFYTVDTQSDTRKTTARAQPRTTSGVRLRSSDLARPAFRHAPAWRNTGFRTAATTSGVAEMLASGHCLRRGRDADAAHVGNVERGTLFALWTFHPAFLAFLAQKFHYLTFFESKSQRFSLSLWDCNILAWIFLNIHFFKTPLSAYFS